MQQTLDRTPRRMQPPLAGARKTMSVKATLTISKEIESSANRISY